MVQFVLVPYELIYLVGLLVLLGWSCTVIWRALTVARRARKEPACERCGYPVVGLTAMVCPECGADFRKTGIITPAMEVRRRGSTAGGIAGWTVIWLFMFWLVAVLVALPKGMISAPGTDWDIVYGVPASLSVVWGYGVFVIVRRRRRLLREFGAVPSGSAPR